MNIKKAFLLYVTSVCMICCQANAELTAEEKQIIEADRLISKLVNMSSKQINDTKMEKENTIQSLITIGDPAIPNLLNQFNIDNQDYSVRHSIVRILGDIKSDKAKTGLKDIVLTNKNDVGANIKLWAASLYIESIQKKEDVVFLFESDNASILSMSLYAAQGISLDAQLLSKVDPFLGNQNKTIRWAATKVYEKDPSTTFYSRKIKSIIHAIDKTYTYSDANDIMPRSHLTYANVDLQNYIQALYNMNGPVGVLQEAVPHASSMLARDSLVISLAMRGDRSIKSKLIHIIIENKNDMLRLMAVKGLGNIGDKDDLPLLHDVSQKDPFCYDRKNVEMHTSASLETIYPIREMAQKSIKNIMQFPLEQKQ